MPNVSADVERKGMLRIAQRTAETWFVAGTTSLLEQRMHGFKELSAYLPADEREIADHEAWVRYGEPYSGARRKAGYVNAADFLLKAYAAIAARLVEREGWPEPASQTAKYAIVATLTAIAEDGENASAYDIKVVQAEHAERARLKRIQDEENQKKKEREAALAAEEKLPALLRRMKEEQELRGEAKDFPLRIVIFAICLICLLLAVLSLQLHRAVTETTDASSYLLPAPEAQLAQPVPQTTSSPVVENANLKSDVEEREQRQRQEQAQRAWTEQLEKLRRLQTAREATEKTRQSTATARGSTTQAKNTNPGSIPSNAPNPQSAPRISNCMSDEGTKFTIINRTGEISVGYGTRAPVRAKVDYAGQFIVMLSNILPGDSLTMNIIRGDKDGVSLLFSDDRSNVQRIIGSKCSAVVLE